MEDKSKPDVPSADQAPDTHYNANETATEQAVDDILSKESDELLQVEDEKLAQAFESKPDSFWAKLKIKLVDLWQDKRKRKFLIAGTVLSLALLLGVPTSRYFILNNFGVRSSASVVVLDESTRQPLRNVKVSLHGQSSLTDEDGQAQLNHLKLGTTDLMIEKRAFAPVERQITIGWGSNPLGDFSIKPVGSQYAFMVTDFLSTKPLEKVEAISGEYSAFSDEKGKILLTVEETGDEPLEVIIKKDEYREESLPIPVGDTMERPIALAPSRDHFFVSRRSGQFDVYKVGADGKNDELVLKGTGHERDDLTLVSHPTDKIVALVSTRNNARNEDGFLLSTLTLIDPSDGNSIEKVAESERVQIIDWIGDKLVYVRITSGASAVKPDRHRLVTFDYKTKAYTEIEKSNYFNDVLVANDEIYFAPSSAYQDKPVAMYRIKPDGTSRQTILGLETWNIYRTAYDKLIMSVGQDWYEYDLLQGGYKQLEGEPANLRARVYATSPDKQKSVWVDQRDGKGVLVVYDAKTKEEKVLHSGSGLKTPVRWLSNNALVFRIKTESETADYAISLDGGEAKKVRDVTDTSGIDRWYYY